MESPKILTIAGIPVTLNPGWYIASRPMADGKITEYPITIKDANVNPVAIIGPLPYEHANEFLREFNDMNSLIGRIW